MSQDKLNELIRQIEELEANEPPRPRGDDGPPSVDIGSPEWFTRTIREDFRPTVGGRLTESVRALLDASRKKEISCNAAGLEKQAQQWGQVYLNLMHAAVEQFGFDAVVLDGLPDELLPLAISAADIREALKDNPDFQKHDEEDANN